MPKRTNAPNDKKNAPKNDKCMMHEITQDALVGDGYSGNAVGFWFLFFEPALEFLDHFFVGQDVLGPPEGFQTRTALAIPVCVVCACVFCRQIKQRKKKKISIRFFCNHFTCDAVPWVWFCSAYRPDDERCRSNRNPPFIYSDLLFFLSHHPSTKRNSPIHQQAIETQTHNCQLHNCPMHNCQMHNSPMHKCQMHRCQLLGSQMHKYQLHNCQMHKR